MDEKNKEIEKIKSELMAYDKKVSGLKKEIEEKKNMYRKNKD